MRRWMCSSSSCSNSAFSLSSVSLRLKRRSVTCLLSTLWDLFLYSRYRRVCIFRSTTHSNNVLGQQSKLNSSGQFFITTFRSNKGGPKAPNIVASRDTPKVNLRYRGRRTGPEPRYCKSICSVNLQMRSFIRKLRLI